MIRRTWRAIVKFLRSPVLATWLLVIAGVWSALATLIPQGGAADPRVAAWAATHSLVEPVVRAVGLHQAFTSVVFIACALALALSTALCAWQRTGVAIGKGRILREAAGAGERSLAESHDLEIACDPALSRQEVLSIASATLASLGIRTKPQGASVVAVSPAWTVWGSPVFHWSLLALIVTMALGGMVRSSGQIGLAVGQSRPDEPASYGLLSAGPLHRWTAPPRAIRVDAFDVNYKSGGVDRGPTPTVTVLDPDGRVIESQLVYPNKTLKVGSLTIYPIDYGLSVTVLLLGTDGEDTGRSTQLVDFSTEATGGTAPVGALRIGGGGDLRALLSVPLDRVEGGYAARVPDEPAARVVVVDAAGRPVLDRVMRPGGQTALPGGGNLRLVDVGYYARLQLVDDPSIPFLYVGLTVAVIGLAVAALARQQIVRATAPDTPDGPVLAVRVRLWRNATSTRGEIESELARALGGARKESTP